MTGWSARTRPAVPEPAGFSQGRPHGRQQPWRQLLTAAQGTLDPAETGATGEIPAEADPALRAECQRAGKAGAFGEGRPPAHQLRLGALQCR